MTCDCSITENSATKQQEEQQQQQQQGQQGQQPAADEVTQAQPGEPPLSTGAVVTADQTSPTEMLRGENIECYAKRASTNGKNDVAEKIPNTIDNTSISCDLNNFVSERFKLTPGSTRTAVDWQISINGQMDLARPNLSKLNGLQFIGGNLTGTLSTSIAGKTFKVKIIAIDGDGEIDSKEYNLTVKSMEAAVVKFLFPYEGNGRVTCSFGPRNPPTRGASSMHKGMDISQPGSELGYILSSADGIVVKCGPARGFGNWIVIEHRDAAQEIIATTVYGHMNEIYVREGQRVSAGQRIAKEGNAGIGTAAHLHFELHKGKLGNPVDPLPYINGQMRVAQNNLKGQFGIPDERSFVDITNNLRGMSKDEKPTECGALAQTAIPENLSGLSIPSSAPTSTAISSSREIVERTLNADVSLSNEDKNVLLTIADISSGFNAAARNPASTAKGVFQMTDKTAGVYYKKIGADPAGNDRFNPELSTKAQIRFYKEEMEKYWNEFNATKLPGPATLAGRKLSIELTEKYSTLSKGEFLYGLIHHDGVKNAVVGNDLQGVEYYRRSVSFAETF